MSFRDIKDGWHNYLVSNLIKNRKPNKAVQTVIDNRIEICLSCPHLTKTSSSRINIYFQSCKKCNCAFPALVFAYRKKCPANKWGVIQGVILNKDK
jgi:hypothetical protein